MVWLKIPISTKINNRKGGGMKLDISFQEDDNQALVSFVKANQKRIFVVQRELRNVNGKIPLRSREDIWLTMAMCLFTTQQRSGPKSPISRFLLAETFPLSLEECSKVNDIEKFIQQKIEGFGGIRFGPKIAKQMKHNYDVLFSGEWPTMDEFGSHLEEQRKSDPSPEHYSLERKAALYIQKTFSGFGPKQSRNFWQSLGLTRYEFVLDSRVLKWLRTIGFPLPLSSMALGEEEYYCFVSDILRNWCIQTEILPCILDAAIFSSYDTDEWPEDASVW
jgi:hypothetical protein